MSAVGRCRPRWTIAATLLVIVSGAQFVALTPQAAAAEGGLVASPTAPHIVKEKVQLSGSLPPAASRPVGLQRRNGGRWSVVERTQSDATGSFSFEVSAPARVDSQASYRVWAGAVRIGGVSYPATETPVVVLETVEQRGWLDAPAEVAVGNDIAFSAAFTPPRPGRPVRLQRRDGTSWVTLPVTATQGTDGTAAMILPTTQTGTWTYRAVARKYNGAPQVATLARSVSVVSAQDTTPPDVPTALTATPGDAQVSLDWDAVLSVDHGGFHVYAAEAADTPDDAWTRLNGSSVSESSFVANGLSNGTTYWFAVTSVDQLGNESARSTPESGTPVDATAPAVPAGLAATPADGSVDLSWDAVTDPDLAGYAVYRSDSGDSPWTRLNTATVTGTAYTDETATNGTEYWYAVASLDQTGNESARSLTARATPVDSTPPPVPQGVTGSAGDGSATVRWSAVTASDLAGYHVYQYSFAQGVWLRVTDAPTTASEHAVTGLPNDVTAYFAVRSIDITGNESGSSNIVSVTPGDRTPPPVPGDPTATASAGTVVLTWPAVEATDLASYRVWRTADSGATWTQVATVAAASPRSWTDTGLRNGIERVYAVSAVDARGNDSGRSSSVAATPAGAVPGGASFNAGQAHSCEVRAAGTLWCWGSNANGQFGDGTTLSSPRPVQVGTRSDWATVGVGDFHTCAVRVEGSLWCWGWGFYGQLGTGGFVQALSPVRVGADVGWVQVTGGNTHSCALRSDTTIRCWGGNGAGQLGDGTTTERRSPVAVEGSGWVSIEAGTLRTCATRADGSAWCWGNGPLGDGGSGHSSTPVQVVGAGAWDRLSVGYGHTCGTRPDRTLWCWGSDNAGQLGNGPGGSTVTTPSQVGTGSDWQAVAAGENHACASRGAGTLWCWGWNSGGQAGAPGDLLQVDTPGQVGSATGWTELSAGGQHTCGRQAGTLRCFGDFGSGLLGDGRSKFLVSPVVVDSDPQGLTEVTLGSFHTCGLKEGRAWCWGDNWSGQFGDGQSRRDRHTPGPGPAGTDWTALEAGYSHTCGLRADSTLWCWGNRGAGVLGDGTNSSSHTPVAVASDQRWSSVSSSWTHVCAVRADSTLWCWGDNQLGGLGDGTTTARAVPTQVGDQADWVSVDAGMYRTCGIRSDGSLWCWGGSVSSALVPTRVGTETNWTSVSTTYGHACGTRSDGTAWCWGSNWSGELGNGTTTASAEPVQVGAATDWAEVAAGGNGLSCGVRQDGGLWCWGTANQAGLGDGTPVGSDPVSRPTPVRIGIGQYTGVDLNSRAGCATRVDGSTVCWGHNFHGELGQAWRDPAPSAVLE